MKRMEVGDGPAANPWLLRPNFNDSCSTSEVTLKDLFAGLAVGGLMALAGQPPVSPEDSAEIARVAYDLAEALLTERAARGR